jgi:hypothetical protein
VDTPNSNTLFAASSNSIPSNNATKEIGMDTAAMDISPDDVTPDPALMNIAPSCDKSNSDSNLNMVSQNLQKKHVIFMGSSSTAYLPQRQKPTYFWKKKIQYLGGPKVPWIEKKITKMLILALEVIMQPQLHAFSLHYFFLFLGH